MLPDTFERWLTGVDDTDYFRDQVITMENQKFFIEATGGNINGLNVLRTIIARVLNPMIYLHTGYYLSGFSGSGKSVIAALLMCLVPNLTVSCELQDFDNTFSRTELVYNNFIMLNEFVKLSPQSEKHIKAIIGRDYISCEVKYVQGYISKQFPGIIVIVSNLGSDITSGHTGPWKIGLSQLISRPEWVK